MEIMIASRMASSLDPKTLKPWWQELTPSDGPYPDLILAQRENFYVLIAHRPGSWVVLVGEGKYSSPPDVPPLYTGFEHNQTVRAAERYIRQRDPSFKADWPQDLFGE
jgi:hypothetical protein